MKRTYQKQPPRRGRSTGRLQRVLVPYMAVLLIVMTIVVVFATRGSGGASASGVGPTPGQAGKPLSWCGQDGRAPCPAVDPGWLSVNSDLPGDIARVIAVSPDFQRMRQRYGGGALDVPMLVHPYHPADPTAGSDYFVDDHWVVTVRNSAGQESGIFDFVYDRANHRIRFSSYAVLHPSDQYYGHAFPFVSADTAVAQLATQCHLTVLVGMAPELIFFPIAADRLGPEAPHHWSDGGTSPMDPMWRLTGANGLSYFVGANLHVHAEQDLYQILVGTRGHQWLAHGTGRGLKPISFANNPTEFGITHRLRCSTCRQPL